MKTTRRIVTAAALLLGTFGTTVAGAADLPFTANAAGHEPPFRIGVSNGYIGNTWRAQFVADIEKVAEEFKAEGDVAEVTILNSTSGASGQLTQVNSLINSGVDALLINPESTEALKPVIARALASGILVVIGDNPMGHPNAISITLDQNQFWGIQTEWLVDQLKGKGNIVSIEGIAGVTGSELRVAARDEVLAKNPDIKLLASVPGGWDQAKAREVMSSLLTAHDQIDGVLIQDVMADGVVRAYDTSGRTLPPMSGDYVHSFLKLWKSRPDINAITVTNPPGIGASSLRFVVALLRGHQLNPDVLQPSPADPSIANTILLPEPTVVTREAETDKPWCNEGTECIGLDEALARLEGQPDSTALDGMLTQQQVLDRYFLK